MLEKRRFTRIVFSTPVNIVTGDKSVSTELIDLSLKGALVAEPKDWVYDEDADYKLCFHLDGSDVEIEMEVELSHQRAHYLGWNCHHIGIESVSHLKRLIELNVGDEDLLYRELADLSHPPAL
ncbi:MULTISPECIES: PilZ domain-containing protein [Corallincola]|uniref:Cyclic diguanosine monophosphate-binding protein n=3 Tax=Corallincola TaxID=1775176 RepID=A0A368N4Y1_9GAMM|nr:MULTISPECIES: PilZ domain-containing protein [Corallincola]RCU45230.1 PilZ domain-containing protein [Corallincola holothuriorum]TAA43618.1 PilZ domain-containing protein [Corallincola spongiicola]TCI02871.1 PilZ domain-containing protein [Corallincola luteus]